jgi:putative FmdB family regulatory protein
LGHIIPTYNYICTACNHEWEEFQKIANMNAPLACECPSCKELGRIEKRIYHAPPLGDSVRLGISKTDGGFKDVMKNIHHRTPGSMLDKTSTITKI